MRKQVQRKLQRNLLLLWAVGGIVLWAVLWSTRGVLHHDDWGVIITVLSIMGIILYHYATEVFTIVERREKKYRKTPGVRMSR